MEAVTLVARQAPSASFTPSTLIPSATATSSSSSSGYDDGFGGGWVEQDGQLIPFWYSRTGIIVKWSVFLSLLALVAAYIVFGRQHARRRMRKGLPPLAYHRYLVSRAELARSDPRYAYPQATYNTYNPNYHQSDYYGMQNMAPPPPMYDPNAARPPVYEGSAGADKMASSQQTSGVTATSTTTTTTGSRHATVEDANDVPPPAGPPPASANPFRG